MIFNGLSEKEMKIIGELLEKHNIKFKIGLDKKMLSKNQKRMNKFTRGKTGFSLQLLSIKIDDKQFLNMNEELKEELLRFGITNEIPEGFEPP